MAAGCEEPAAPGPVGSLTITDIPTETVAGKAAFKIYISASNEQDHTKRHVAQGTALISGETSVTINLYNPPANWNENPDPDENSGSWNGTARYYSAAISPQTVANQSDILFGAGLGLNDSKQTVKWADLAGLAGAMSTGQKNAIYTLIILKDNDITSP
jgi:hypothetical protein